ncbi:hypothetical protein I79_009963 [Cricetulus griseus]|uniref:Secreted protein n=1 Tax=Cricetulus griseus TaxID=10029 RepID=G3HH66_CRIGR|nr:hypothetical protein I79_009963 [Cricetulus griseus]
MGRKIPVILICVLSLSHAFFAGEQQSNRALRSPSSADVRWTARARCWTRMWANLLTGQIEAGSNL